MRPILVVLALAGLAAPAFAAQPSVLQARPPADEQARCQRYQPQPAAEAPRAKGAMKLTEAPPARMERAVNRRIDGCAVPVIVRYDVEKRDR